MKIPDHVIYRYESRLGDGTTFVFDLDALRVMTTNELGYRVLRQIDEGLERKDIARSLAAASSSPEQAERRIDGFIGRLVAEGYAVA